MSKTSSPFLPSIFDNILVSIYVGVLVTGFSVNINTAYNIDILCLSKSGLIFSPSIQFFYLENFGEETSLKCDIHFYLDFQGTYVN